MGISKSFDTPSYPDRLPVPKGTKINKAAATEGTAMKPQNPRAQPDGAK